METAKTLAEKVFKDLTPEQQIEYRDEFIKVLESLQIAQIKTLENQVSQLKQTFGL